MVTTFKVKEKENSAATEVKEQLGVVMLSRLRKQGLSDKCIGMVYVAVVLNNVLCALDGWKSSAERSFLGDRYAVRPAIGPLSVLSVLSLSCLSVTLVYCGQRVGWIRIPLGTEIRLDPGDIV